MKRIVNTLALFALIGLSGCASMKVTDTSLLDGRREMGRADMRLYPVRIVAIDGDYTVDRDTVRAEPGQRTLRLLAAPVAGFTQPVEKDVPFTIEPCKRYYLAARREAPLRQDFQLVVQQVEDRLDCVKS